MYMTYFGKKINHRYTKYTDLGKYSNLITELSQDETIPKFATHLIYMTKSLRKDQIEERVIESIFAQKPKRADVYWFMHIHRTDKPYTLNYEVIELVDDKIIKIILNIGFRIQPRTELYFKNIINELIQNKELNLHLRYNGSTKYNPNFDFKFILLEKFLSVENEFALREGLILKSYFFLKRFAQRDQKAFGIDKSDVLIEQIPVLYQPYQDMKLIRKYCDKPL